MLKRILSFIRARRVLFALLIIVLSIAGKLAEDRVYGQVNDMLDTALANTDFNVDVSIGNILLFVAIVIAGIILALQAKDSIESAQKNSIKHPKSTNLMGAKRLAEEKFDREMKESRSEREVDRIDNPVLIVPLRDTEPSSVSATAPNAKAAGRDLHDHSTIIVNPPTVLPEPKEANVTADNEVVDGCISIVIHNHETEMIECYCTWESFYFDGEPDNYLKTRIRGKDGRVSWARGDNGKRGFKYIDGDKDEILNIAQPDIRNVTFWTASGEIDSGKENGLGTYRINMKLWTKIGNGEFKSRPIYVTFKCVEMGYPCQDDTSDIACRSKILYTDFKSDCVCIQLIRGE